VINGISAGEDHRRMALNINLLFAEFFGWNSLEPDEGIKIQIDIILSTKLKIGRLFAFGPRLRYEYSFPVCNRNIGFYPLFYHVCGVANVVQIYNFNSIL
jgi:hypothetical protein